GICFGTATPVLNDGSSEARSSDEEVPDAAMLNELMESARQHTIAESDAHWIFEVEADADPDDDSKDAAGGVEKFFDVEADKGESDGSESAEKDSYVDEHGNVEGLIHDSDGVEKRVDSDVLMAEKSHAVSAGAEEAPPPPEPHPAERVRRRITGKRALQVVQEQGPALAHVRVAAAAPMKRPAKKRFQCHVRPCPTCMFSMVAPGAAAQTKKRELCAFCSPETMRKALSEPRGRGNVTRSLRAFLQADRQDAFDVALQRLPSDEERDKFRKALRRETRNKDAAAQSSQADKRQQEKVGRLQSLMNNRVAVTPAPTDEQRADYEEHVKDDERRFKNKFKAVQEARDREDDSWRSEAAVKLEQWCRQGAWVQREQCKRMEKRHLRPVDIEGR
ncbi:unnamed protein product, partial [Prorocentrum cordatum]